MTDKLNPQDQKVLTALESGTPEGIRDAAQQMSRMQNNDEWGAIQAQFKTDKKDNAQLPNIDFGPDGSMVIHGVKGLPEGDRFDGPRTAVSEGRDPGIEHKPAPTSWW